METVDTSQNVPDHWCGIVLSWHGIKGRSGVECNEIADRLAKRGVNEEPDDVPVFPRSSEYYRAAFKDHLYERWIARWRSTDLAFGRQTKIWFPEPSFRKTRRLLSLDRPQFSRMGRWLTGHAFLGLQNFRCGSTALSFCRLCGQVPERADHLLLRCPRLNGLRASTFRAWTMDYHPVWEVDWIEKFLSDEVVAKLEDPTNSPEAISGREEQEEVSSTSMESSDSG